MRRWTQQIDSNYEEDDDDDNQEVEEEQKDDERKDKSEAKDQGQVHYRGRRRLSGTKTEF